MFPEPGWLPGGIFQKHLKAQVLAIADCGKEQELEQGIGVIRKPGKEEIRKEDVKGAKGF